MTYWLKWPTEITGVLVGAEWEADIEGVPLLWDEGKGWRLMMDDIITFLENNFPPCRGICFPRRILTIPVCSHIKTKYVTATGNTPGQEIRTDLLLFSV